MLKGRELFGMTIRLLQHLQLCSLLHQLQTKKQKTKLKSKEGNKDATFVYI